MADIIEEAMANAGYRGNTEALRPANEIRFEARWKLGQLLAKVNREERERSSGGTYVSGRDTGFRAYLKEIGLNKNRANILRQASAISAISSYGEKLTSGQPVREENNPWLFSSVEDAEPAAIAGLSLGGDE